MPRMLVVLLLAVPWLLPQDQELQCKCRKLEGDEYLCKCVAAKGGALVYPAQGLEVPRLMNGCILPASWQTKMETRAKRITS